MISRTSIASGRSPDDNTRLIMLLPIQSSPWQPRSTWTELPGSISSMCVSGLEASAILGLGAISVRTTHTEDLPQSRQHRQPRCRDQHLDNHPRECLMNMMNGHPASYTQMVTTPIIDTTTERWKFRLT